MTPRYWARSRRTETRQDRSSWAATCVLGDFIPTHVAKEAADCESRRCLPAAWRPSATDVSDTLQVALRGSGLNQVRVLHRPRLLSDNVTQPLYLMGASHADQTISQRCSIRPPCNCRHECSLRRC